VMVTNRSRFNTRLPAATASARSTNGVDGQVVVTVPLERPLPDDAAVAGLNAGAHGAGGLDDLSVVESIAAALEMIGEIVRRFPGLRTDDKAEPGLLQRQEGGC
jgi:hypothetical protein